MCRTAQTKENKLEKKRRIIESAYQLFSKNGVYNTVVDDIVKTTGIARGTFYLYFKDKSDLIEQMIFFKSAESMKELLRKADREADDYPDVLSFARAFIDMYIDILIDHKDILIVIDKNISACMQFFPDFYDEEAKTLYRKFVDRFIRAGYPEEEIDRKIYMVVCMLSGVCSDAILHGRPYEMSVIREPLVAAVMNVLELGQGGIANERKMAI